MAKRQFFITGTDTDAGKTLITQGLLEKANQAGLQTIGLKPVAAGCEPSAEGLRNSDALFLQQAASIKLSYAEVNPFALEPPIAPHLAALEVGKRLSAERIAAVCRGAMMTKYDFLLVEGAGGWRVPLNERETFARVPALLNMPVILVVGMKLGCINHAMLTAEAILRDGLEIAGWVANRVDPNMEQYEGNVDTLKHVFRFPLLGEVPYLEDRSAASVAKFLDISVLLE